MPRPVRKRKVCTKDLKYRMFEPVGRPREDMPVVELNLDEYEVVNSRIFWSMPRILISLTDRMQRMLSNAPAALWAAGCPV